MHEKYYDLFDTLVKAYYNGNFEDALEKIMVCHEKSPQETFAIICSICGVKLEFDNDYVYNLKKAITHYSVNKRLIEKLDGCVTDCPPDKDKKFNCQAACPFNAIIYDEKSKSTQIDTDNCLNCGLCVSACKGGRILDKIEFLPVADLIKNNKTVIAAVAPAIMGQFGDDVTMDQLRAAFIEIGFTDMIEVAFAADMLTIKEAVEFDKHVNSPSDFMITSCCCPMWVGMLKKVYKDLVPNLSPSVSPMIAAGRVIKSLNEDAKVVFIGPCIAKKAEAKDKDIVGAIDFVLTFQEVENIFKALDIKPEFLEGIPSKDYTARGGRLYARTGGVSEAVSDMVEELYPNKHKYFSSVKADGIKDCKELLEKALKGEVKASFVEGMGCEGGCVGGPKALIPADKGKDAVNEYAYGSPIKIATHSDTLDVVFNKLGITSLKDFEDKDKIQIFEREF
ncbi:Iron only hydrogenase large subunit, C-terminal domain [Clostridium cavendishii DSM 21758]|uniref:Iron only hydrogenase large subunit, C-terminal domain n=1 Tax=Clostridium cavendishii DSM 21758 TaxID=1121302 RepID=A0A1M6GH22_9CLOT|nr:[Fe-Fe] hydrogenase large subunit C-terminal domain-containing protein [Clostridium cavendishii]SHJ09162.1 Iron only hydrogenase large subunit, C-terminal domain [Clostridium cavendishii DSM 21758]